MKWRYTNYPVLENGVPTFKSGEVEIRATSLLRLLPPINMGAHAPPTTIPTPLNLPYVGWEIVSDVTDDLRRFIAGRYWHKIDTGLMAERLRMIGMMEQAEVYETFARG